MIDLPTPLGVEHTMTTIEIIEEAKVIDLPTPLGVEHSEALTCQDRTPM